MSTEVATPISPILAALASDAINRNGTPVVITLLSLGVGIISVDVWELTLTAIKAIVRDKIYFFIFILLANILF